MSESYYKPCRNLNICNELIEKYFNTQQYEKCFEGHLALAEQGYPLAECQVGYFYYDGLDVEKDLAKAVWWTRRAADHGDRDGQCNLAWFYEDGIGVERDMEQAAFWYRQAALQDHDLAIDKCKELGISLDDEITDREGASEGSEMQGVSAELSAVLQVHGDLLQLQRKADSIKAQEAGYLGNPRRSYRRWRDTSGSSQARTF